MDDSTVHAQSACAEVGYCLRQKNPLRVLHDALLQGLRCVAILYFNGLLRDNCAAVYHFGYKMYGRTGNLYPFCQRGFMHAQTVEASPQKEGMSEGCTLIMRFSKWRQKLSGRTVIKPASTIRPMSAFSSRAVSALPYSSASEKSLRRSTSEGIAAFAARSSAYASVGRNNERNLSVFDLARLLCVNERLQVRAAARNQNCNVSHLFFSKKQMKWRIENG